MTISRKRKRLTGILLLVLFFLGVVGVAVYSRSKDVQKNNEKVETTQEEESVEEQPDVTDTETETEEVDPRIEQAIKNKIPTLVISNADAKSGDTITVRATLVNNPGVLGMSLTLSYDVNALKLLSVKNGKAFEDVLVMSNTKELDSGCVFLWDGEYLEENQIIDGEILVMEFQVLESAPVGKTPILLISDTDSTVDNDLEILDIAVENGFVTVQE